ncbi:hypothetical protein DFP72DRAFT_921278 [Ephemerocybe angulata]|uniref:Uncharacterized protein n=1 Tax=Ephemerocybe angulata TaxID=980116 RepID=A0A8H6LZR2_9AGAR|nr:hypothetical protein DFP72DRAFT_921278 [Tulosesus angulatus]
MEDDEMNTPVRAFSRLCAACGGRLLTVLSIESMGFGRPMSVLLGSCILSVFELCRSVAIALYETVGVSFSLVYVWMTVWGCHGMVGVGGLVWSRLVIAVGIAYSSVPVYYGYDG